MSHRPPGKHCPSWSSLRCLCSQQVLMYCHFVPCHFQFYQNLGGHAVGSAWFLCTLTGNCPSFADMGMALEQLLTGEGAAEQEVTSSISPEFQLLLSWCWLNLKAGVELILSWCWLKLKAGVHLLLSPWYWLNFKAGNVMLSLMLAQLKAGCRCVTFVLVLAELEGRCRSNTFLLTLTELDGRCRSNTFLLLLA